MTRRRGCPADIADGFAVRLRREIDVSTVTTVLTATAHRAVRPTTAAIRLHNVADSPRSPIS